MDFLISQIVKEHAGPITDCSADQKSEANGRVQPLDYDFADGRRTILEIGGAEEDRTPDLRIAKPSFTVAVTFNQSLTHADPARM